MGDLETDFLEKIETFVDLRSVDVLFAPHHGRYSGRVPESWLAELNPQLIIIGEAPSEHLHYYDGYNTLTQNSAGDISLDCETGRVHVFVSSPTYTVNFLKNENQADKSDAFYLGSFEVG